MRRLTSLKDNETEYGCREAGQLFYGENGTKHGDVEIFQTLRVYGLHIFGFECKVYWMDL